MPHGLVNVSYIRSRFTDEKPKLLRSQKRAKEASFRAVGGEPAVNLGWSAAEAGGDAQLLGGPGQAGAVGLVGVQCGLVGAQVARLGGRLCGLFVV